MGVFEPETESWTEGQHRECHLNVVLVISGSLLCFLSGQVSTSYWLASCYTDLYTRSFGVASYHLVTRESVESLVGPGIREKERDHLYVLILVLDRSVTHKGQSVSWALPNCHTNNGPFRIHIYHTPGTCWGYIFDLGFFDRVASGNIYAPHFFFVFLFLSTPKV